MSSGVSRLEIFYLFVFSPVLNVNFQMFPDSSLTTPLGSSEGRTGSLPVTALTGRFNILVNSNEIQSDGADFMKLTLLNEMPGAVL